jgi:hypothetical protein
MDVDCQDYFQRGSEGSEEENYNQQDSGDDEHSDIKQTFTGKETFVKKSVSSRDRNSHATASDIDEDSYPNANDRSINMMEVDIVEADLDDFENAPDEEDVNTDGNLHLI